MDFRRKLTCVVFGGLIVGLFTSTIQSGGIPGGIGKFEIVTTKGLEITDENGNVLIRMGGLGGGIITLGDSTNALLLSESNDSDYKIGILKDGTVKCALHTDTEGNGELILFNNKGEKTSFKP